MMMRRSQYFLALCILLVQLVCAQKCSICGSDNIRPGNLNTFYNIRYFGTYSCPALYDMGQKGQIPGYICGIIQSRLYSACQCGQAPSGGGTNDQAPFTIPPGLNLPPSFSNNLNLQTPKPTPNRAPPPPPQASPTRRPTRPPTRPPTRRPTTRPTPGPTPSPTTARPTPGPTRPPTPVPTQAPTDIYTRKERSAGSAAKESRFTLARQRGGSKLEELRLIYNFNKGNRKLENEPQEMEVQEESSAAAPETPTES
ncbi:MAG: hypothetical protein SGBAC_002935 [Bacillariaceae sp.]